MTACEGGRAAMGLEHFVRALHECRGMLHGNSDHRLNASGGQAMEPMAWGRIGQGYLDVQLELELESEMVGAKLLHAHELTGLMGRRCKGWGTAGLDWCPIEQ